MPSIFKTDQRPLETVVVGYDPIGELELLQIGSFSVNESKFCRAMFAEVDSRDKIHKTIAEQILPHYLDDFQVGDLVDRLSNISEYSEFEEQFKTDHPLIYRDWLNKLSEYADYEQLVLTLCMIRVRLKNTVDSAAIKKECDKWTIEDLKNPKKIHPALVSLLYLFATVELMGEPVKDWSVFSTKPEKQAGESEAEVEEQVPEENPK